MKSPTSTVPFADVADRFPLGTCHGIVVPTSLPVTDTDTTPFGLTLRTTPTNCQVAGGATMGTDKVTLLESDGNGDASDVDTDYLSD